MRLVILIYYLSHLWRLDSMHDLIHKSRFVRVFVRVFYFLVCVCVLHAWLSPRLLQALASRFPRE